LVNKDANGIWSDPYKAIREEYIEVFEALFTHPIVSGTYGIVPPQENPTQPFFLGETICKTVSNGATFVSGSAIPKVTPLVPVQPE
jgi:hypothetical protein